MPKPVAVVLGSTFFGLAASVGYVMLTALTNTTTDWQTAKIVFGVATVVALLVGFLGDPD